jgi:ATP-binding cassette subfamily F protein 3
VALARMLVEPANTLLLDEPTNHLDPPSVDVLTDALTDFPGTLVFISHDPVFLARVATRIVEIEDGQARGYHGDYEYYLWKKAQEVGPIKGNPDEAAAAVPTDAPRSQSSNKDEAGLPPAMKGPGGQRRDLTKALARVERQVSRLEEQIAEGEQRVQARDRELAGESLYQDHARWNTLNKERAAWVEEQSELTTRWAGLCEEAEGLRAKLKELESVL